MILSFADHETEKVFSGQRSRKLPAEIQEKARRKLLLLHAAVLISDLRLPPSNMLEKLAGRPDYWSIRINRQWRICFVWKERVPSEAKGKEAPGDSYSVEINNHYA
ncbi:MAG TPA: type II toxin-antitoxin system RelE/ParE family toxin [Capsulimonadaceae bacterium]|jgi:proteic killer suppression protein